MTNQTWDNELIGQDHVTFDDFAYTYDRSSNRLTRDLSLTTGLDEKYTYDDLNRLIDSKRPVNHIWRSGRRAAMIWPCKETEHGQRRESR